jgi:hypothetical protein
LLLNHQTSAFETQDEFRSSMARFFVIYELGLQLQVRFLIINLIRAKSNLIVAVSASGDIYQWGIDYDSDVKAPELTLQGKNIDRVEMSADTIFALSRDGAVYSIPISKKEQLEGKKPKESAFFGLSSTSSPISYRVLQPTLGFGEKYDPAFQKGVKLTDL